MAGELEPLDRGILIPLTGELVPEDDVAAIGRAIFGIRDIQSQLRSATSALTEAAVELSTREGTKTLRDAGVELTIRSGEETVYDAEAVEQELRDAGMSEERIREIVVETVSYKVSAVELKRAAAANPTYREIMERHSTKIEKAPSVSVKVPPPSQGQRPAKPPEGAES